jgi:hypothetical protein
MSGPQHLGQHPVMFCAMVPEAGKAGLLHQLLLAEEVHTRELDEPVKQLADLLAAAAADQGQPQFVHGVHQDSVLVVHRANFDGAGVVPGEKRHMSLH